MKNIRAVIAAFLAALMLSECTAMAAQKPPSRAGSGSRVKWRGEMAGVGPSGSIKYQVRAVTDGAGGVVLAWEENRFSKACCHDLRDVYLQRYDQSGKPLWGASDFLAAGDNAGEEIVGLLPANSGGATLLWRREGGILYTQEVGSSGTPMLDPGGRILSPCRAGCEWNPVEAFCTDSGEKQAMVSWSESGTPPDVKALKITGKGDSFIYSSGISSLTGENFRAATPVSLGGKGWLVMAWHGRDAGSRIAGQFMNPDGEPDGKNFTVTMNMRSRWMNMECASSGNGALILWSSVNPDELGRSHEIYLSRVERKGDGKPKISSIKLGEARTSAMYIPPVHVGLQASFTWTGRTEFENVGDENLFWRRTSAMFSDGQGGCIALWVEGEKIRVTRVRAGENGLSASKGFTIGTAPDIGFTPFVIPMGEKRWFLVWAEKRERIYRVMGREFSVGGKSPAPVGPAIVLQPDSSGAPRWAATAPAGKDSAWLTLSSLTGGGSGVSIRLGRLSW